MPLAAAFLVAFAAFGLGAGPAAAEEPAPDRRAARFEVDFLMDMIDHHAMAVEMAEMCLDKAVHPELEGLCENIESSQSAELEQMQGWLADWYGVSHEPEMKPGDMRQMTRLAALSGAEFEVEFMESMTRHHRTAIREAEKCLRREAHPDLDDLCSTIIETQSAEIVWMKQWLCQWYDRCGHQGRREAG